MMTTRRTSRLIRDDYLAEVDVDLLYTDDEWSPYLSVEDAVRLDEVREALRRRDIETAAKIGRVHRIVAITVKDM